MGAGAFVPKDTLTSSFLGTYAENVYPNPIVTTTLSGFTVNGLTFSEETDPKSRPPGDIDDFAFYPYLEGPFRDDATAVNKISFSLIQEQYTAYSNMYAVFNSAVTSYDTLRNAYNEKLNEEKVRNESLITSAFGAAIALPTRPCFPDQPPAFTGI
jgi:hypothetical protein